MICYKSMKYQGDSLVQIPGYCCSDVSHNGLYYLSIIGLYSPLYAFDAPEGMVPWGDDDIVGIMPQTEEYQKAHEYMQKMGLKNSDLPELLFNNEMTEDEDFPWEGLVRIFNPGWVWSEMVVTGTPGESIVNVPASLQLVDGPALLQVIEQAEKLGLASRQALLEEARDNGTPYNIDFESLINPADQIAEMIDDDPDIIDDKVEREKEKHRRNLKKFFSVRS